MIWSSVGVIRSGPAANPGAHPLPRTPQGRPMDPPGDSQGGPTRGSFPAPPAAKPKTNAFPPDLELVTENA